MSRLSFKSWMAAVTASIAESAEVKPRVKGQREWMLSLVTLVTDAKDARASWRSGEAPGWFAHVFVQREYDAAARAREHERQELTSTIDHWLNHPEITTPNIRDLIKRLDSLGGRP